MPLIVDAEILRLLRSAALPRAQTPAPGDPVALRNYIDSSMRQMDSTEPDSPNVMVQEHRVAVPGGNILARWYARSDRTGKSSSVLYFHGGGMVGGSVALVDRLVSRYVEITGVPFLSIDYRLAPEHPGTAPIDDGYATLAWFVQRVEEFDVLPARIAVMGESGGGGVAAGVAIAARDAGIALASQILIFPMLDDRNVDPDPELVPHAGWTYDNNRTAWTALLGDERGSDGVTARSAPARLADFAGLAPAFIDVGDLDIFRDEDLRYGLELARAGVSTELHLRAGCMHGFDQAVPTAAVSQRSLADRYRVIQSL